VKYQIILKMLNKFFLFFFLTCSAQLFSQVEVLKFDRKLDTINHKNKMIVEVWSDVMCPFCYIGKKKFETALAQFAHKDEVEIRWKSFQLDPDVKADDAKNYTTFLAQKKGMSLEQVKGMFDNVTNVAAEVGLRLDFDKAIVANSFDAHRLTHLAAQYGKKVAAKEALFIAHFTEGKDIADHSVLLEIAHSIGLEKSEVADMLKSDLYAQEVNQDIQEAAQLGISSVPFFVINRKYAISGAQDSSVFLGALKKAFEE
jgi:predicted DsbA family dithiol-disulfide isomerase